MPGFLLGVACGAAELFLLLRLVHSVTAGEPIPLWIVPAKMAALAVFLLPCGLFFAEQLPWAGAGAAAVLILGAAARFAFGARPKKHSAGKEGGA